MRKRTAQFVARSTNTKEKLCGACSTACNCGHRQRLAKERCHWRWCRRSNRRGTPRRCYNHRWLGPCAPIGNASFSGRRHLGRQKRRIAYPRRLSPAVLSQNERRFCGITTERCLPKAEAVSCRKSRRGPGHVLIAEIYIGDDIGRDQRKACSFSACQHVSLMLRRYKVSVSPPLYGRRRRVPKRSRHWTNTAEQPNYRSRFHTLYVRF
jgi:hypothetical protein